MAVASGKMRLTLVELHEQPRVVVVAPDVFIEDDFSADTLDSIWTLDRGAVLETANDRVRFTANGAASDNGGIHYNVNDLPLNPTYWEGIFDLEIGGGGAQGEGFDLKIYTQNTEEPGNAAGLRVDLNYQWNEALLYNDGTLRDTGTITFPNGVHRITVRYENNAVVVLHGVTEILSWASGPLTFPSNAAWRSISVYANNGGGVSADHYLTYIRFEVLA